ncbi:MAG: VIT1/CCC1 transporter family protein [Halofilum sp. (in: g-proteobacteria)]|nr:VIT1/CCC1 transporter family protein [Halofilum sp. (in: g-proteobacteria)]
MSDHRAILADHRPEAIRRRLARSGEHDYLADAVLGGIDGCVTTFAVVAGATGGALSPLVVIILGFANLVADGFSMAVSNYHGTRSAREFVSKQRRAEEQHIDRVPEGEREEIRQIFARKGFEGDTLERVVDTITANRRLWVDTMLTEEHGLQLSGSDPVRAGATTFAAFIVVGLVPLLPYLLPTAPEAMFGASCVLTAAAFFGIGWAKGQRLQQPRLRSAWQTLWTGGAAAVLAYLVGWGLRAGFGTA